VTLHVDHILPRSIYPEFALDIQNLQILCEDCNLAKSNTSAMDWRR
jgi:5-methylcytosine-specific restriction endonuclease McrA